MRSGLRDGLVAALLLLGSVGALGQAAQAPAAAQAPLAAQAPPAATIDQPGASAAPPPAPAGTAAARPALVPEPGDPGNVDEVILPAKPTVALSGRSSWTDGMKSLRDAFARIEAEIGKAGLTPAGRPIAVFTQTADDDFRFDAMIPIAALPEVKPALPPDFRFATTLSGKAWRFVHKGGYDDVDATYETITTYLEAKDIAAKDVFMEEFVNDVADPSDVNLELNIYVQPR